LLNLQTSAGQLLEAHEHPVAMQPAKRKGFQDEQIESALEQIDGRFHA
jgi:hypothetical protein